MSEERISKDEKDVTGGQKFTHVSGIEDSGWIENPEGAVDVEGNRRTAAGVAEALKPENVGDTK